MDACSIVVHNISPGQTNTDDGNGKRSGSSPYLDIVTALCSLNVNRMNSALSRPPSRDVFFRAGLPLLAARMANRGGAMVMVVRGVGGSMSIKYFDSGADWMIFRTECERYRTRIG